MFPYWLVLIIREFLFLQIQRTAFVIWSLNVWRVIWNGPIRGSYLMPKAMSSTSSPLGISTPLTIMLLIVLFHAGLPGQTANKHQATLTIDATHPVRQFDPNLAIGAGIDGHDFGSIDKLLSVSNITRMQSVGFKPITYRLRTELANDAWHWNPQGSWSDKTGQQGYWISDDRPGSDISLSYGYSLPRRGNSIDQANDDGFSRIDDGDPESFWKSNPYLDKNYTHEDNSLHEQWVVIDLDTEMDINAVKILWGTPFAEKYEIQYGAINDISDISENPPGLWHSFPTGSVETRTGGEILTRVSNDPIKARFIRVRLEKSSNTRPKNSSDIRDRLGFAIREIYVGAVDATGKFTNLMERATKAEDQTTIYVSSTDPWHRSVDLDKNAEHAGFDRIFNNGLAADSPVLMPVGMLYDTPENAAAEIRYLIRKGYKFDRVEMGEEPDGQYISPNDYGALYIQWARAIHKVAPRVNLGGPSFQEIVPNDPGDKPVEGGNPVWFERFMKYLKSHGRSSDFTFFSFEWFPFDDPCTSEAPQFGDAAKAMPVYLAAFRKRGLKADIPIVITEYGYSAFAAQAEVDIEGALFNADTVGTFLAIGGSTAYLHGYEPDQVVRDYPCTAGNNMLFMGDDSGMITAQTATYYGARLMMTEWLQPSGGPHEIYACETKSNIEPGSQGVSAFAVKRPDGKWSIMLINKDPQITWQVGIRFKGRDGTVDTTLGGEADLYQFSARDYKWDAKLQRPTRSRPPEHHRIEDAESGDLELAPYSLTVLRGSIK